MPESSPQRAAARPQGLQAALSALGRLDDRSERIEAIMDLSARYGSGAERRPDAAAQRVPGCESDAYVWSTPRLDGTLDVHVAVRNPNGVAARALAVLLEEGASGAPLDALRALDEGIVAEVFGEGISVAKAMGLGAIVRAVRALAGEPADGGAAT